MSISRHQVLNTWTILGVIVFLFPHYNAGPPGGGKFDAGWGFIITGPVVKDADPADWTMYHNPPKFVTKRGEFPVHWTNRDLTLMALMEGVLAALAVSYLHFGREAADQPTRAEKRTAEELGGAEINNSA